MLKLVKGIFQNEQDTKRRLAEFILGTDILSIGPECAKFEAGFAQYQKRKHCVLVSSGSAANLVLIQAAVNLGWLKAGDKVAFSAITWSTNVMPLVQMGLTPVPVDVELDTLNVSSRTLQEALDAEPEIRALFLTNLLGFCGDLEEIERICSQRKILLLEDNCESLGTVYQGKLLGNWGRASTFSFFVGHHMSTIEGGAICTDDPQLDKMLRITRAHGWDRNLPPADQQAIRKEHGVGDFIARYTFYALAYNFRPTEITGFIGNTQIPHLDRIISGREKHYHRFLAALRENDDFIPLRTDPIDVVSNFAMPVICKTPEICRRYIAAFQAADVEIRPIVGGSIPDQPFYKARYGHSKAIPNARTIQQQAFYFGNDPELTEDELTLLTGLLRKKTG